MRPITKTIEVNGQPVKFRFYMAPGDWRQRYRIYSMGPQCEFYMIKKTYKGLFMQFENRAMVARELLSDKTLHQKLNDAIIETWTD